MIYNHVLCCKVRNDQLRLVYKTENCIFIYFVLMMLILLQRLLSFAILFSILHYDAHCELCDRSGRNSIITGTVSADGLQVLV